MVDSLDRNPLSQATLRAKRVKYAYLCVACGNNSTSILCDNCQSIFNYHPRTKRQPKLLDQDERDLMERMQREIRSGNDKHETQIVINYLVDVGRERFKERRLGIMQSVSEKKFQCTDCGRPISHKGRCLGCNKLSVSGC